MNGSALRRRDLLVPIVGTLVIILFTLGGAHMIARARQDAIDEWKRFLDSFSAATAQHAAQTVKTADVMLQRIIDQVNAAGIDTPEGLRAALGTRATFDMMVERSREVPQIDVATIVADDGTVINFTRSYPPPPINLSDRDYFKAHQANPALDVYLSTPVSNRGTGRKTFYLARKIRSQDGRLLGLALAGIESEYFQSFYKAINISAENSRISLFRDDGILLARFPDRGEVVGKEYGSGAVFERLRAGQQGAAVIIGRPRVDSPDDRRMRIIAPRVTREYPLVSNITVTEDVILERWTPTAIAMGVGIALFDVALAAMLVFATRQLRRRRAMLDQLESARSSAESANAAKSVFLANMSHEIRTPLHGMLGITELLLESGLTAEQRRQAQMLQRSGKALVEIIDALLDLSRVEAGRIDFERTAFDLHAKARDAVGLFRPQAEARGLELSLEVAGDVPRYVRGDPLRLGQILNNLINNAVKFTPKGAIRVSVRGEPRNHVRFAVRDSGIGIAAADVERVFEPFAQADSDTTRRFGGSGLGLAIVKRLVTLQGGELGVESSPGEGSTFWFVLPLPPAEAPTVAVDEGPVEQGTLEGDVLIVEDNPVNMEVACAMLGVLGLTARRAFTAAEALAAVTERIPDVVFMDLQMPDADGIEVTARIRKLEPGLGCPRIPIVALTANAMPADRDRCLAAGMDDFLGKPYSLDQLAHVLRRALPTRKVHPPRESADPHDNIADALKSAESVSPGLANVLVDTFLKTVSGYVGQIETPSGGAAEVERAAHSLRSASERLGALRLAKLCGVLEREAREGSERFTDARLAELRTAVAEACEALNENRR